MNWFTRKNVSSGLQIRHSLSRAERVRSRALRFERQVLARRVRASQVLERRRNAFKHAGLAFRLWWLSLLGVVSTWLAPIRSKSLLGRRSGGGTSFNQAVRDIAQHVHAISRTEGLEDRILLTAELDTYTFVTPQGADVVVVEEISAGVGQISGTSGGVAFQETFTNYKHVVIDTGTNDNGVSQDDVVTFQSLPSGFSGLLDLTVRTGAGDDRIDFSKLATDGAIPISIDAGAGTNTLIGPALDNYWKVTGANQGTVGAETAPKIAFSNVQNLTGAAEKNDLFFFLPGGSISGTVTGQDTDGDAIYVEQAVGATAHSIAFVDGSASVDGTPILKHTGINNPQNVIVNLTAGDDDAVLAVGTTFGTLQVTSNTFDLTRQAAFDAASVSVGDSKIVLPTAHGLANGEQVVYRKGSDANAGITGLTSGTRYYVIRVDDSTVKLASTKEKALAGDALPLSNPVGLGQSLVPFSFQPVTFQQPTGVAVINLLDGTDTLTFGAGGMPNALTTFVDGGLGTDTIIGPAATSPAGTPPETNDWTIDGSNAGSLNGLMVFSGVESLRGGTGIADAFTFLDQGVLTGLLTGQVADSDSIIVELSIGAATDGASRELTFGDGVTKINGSQIVAYAGIVSAKNVQIDGTIDNDRMVFESGASGSAVITAEKTVSGTVTLFGSITLGQGVTSLVIAPGRGDDSVVLNAAILPATVSLSDTYGTDTLAVVVPGTATAQTVRLNPTTADSGSISVGATTIAYTGVESSQNVVIRGTDNNDTMSVGVVDRATLRVSGDTFATITLAKPTGSLTIDAGKGSDSITVAMPPREYYGKYFDGVTSYQDWLALECPLTIDGGDGTNDAVTLHGEYGSVILTAGNETVTSDATIDHLTFVATALDDSIKLTAPTSGTIKIESLNQTFGGLTLPTPRNSLSVNAGAGDDTVAVDMATFAPALRLQGDAGTDTLTVAAGNYTNLSYRFETVTDASDADAKTVSYGGNVELRRNPTTQMLEVRRLYSVGDSTLLEEFKAPQQSLTLETGAGYDQIMIRSLTLNADLTIDGQTGSDSITVTGDILLPGHNLKLLAESITVNPGVTLSTRYDDFTGHTVGNSGSITLDAGGSILSETSTSTITVGL